jgi:hypothetical protein
MKKLIALLFGIAIAVPALTQTMMDVSTKTQTITGVSYSTIDEIYKIWSVRKNIAVSDGFTYKWKLQDDTARYFIPATTPPLLQGEYYEATMTVRKISTTPTPSVQQKDAIAPDVIFSTSPPWSLPSNNQSGWYGNTISFSNVQGSHATFNFTGNGVEIWAEKKPTHGTGKIILIRGTTVISTTDVSFIGADLLPALIYSAKNLATGTYTVRLQVSGGYNLFDSYKVFSDR